ncbi:MAG: glycerol kinase GlpK [Deltaproteobacteria bacterium]|nr:glycerol kinase GlpK [Deltaproteobacteria bacterium]
MKDLVLAIDQGTTGTTLLLINHDLQIVGKKTNEITQYYPQTGWVEHDPNEIWETVLRTLKELLQETGISANRVAAIGITNQRETTILWDRNLGETIARAIVWQDRRTAPICQALKKRGLEKKFQKKTGLLLDPYFSGTKIKWLLDNIEGAREKAVQGSLAFGTVDCYLVYRLTGGRVHVTDASNASRTLLMDLAEVSWDPDLLKILSIPEKILPKIVSCSEVYGQTRGVEGLPDGIPIAGMAGDQQAALFGQACFNAGEVKCTYGTGSFLVMNTGSRIISSRSGMLTTVAWKLGEDVVYALEGSAFVAGAAVQWLRDGLKIIKESAEIEDLASQVPDSGGVTFVPALVGLGAPYWRPEAQGLINGITRGTTAKHIARAVLEGIAFLQHDILKAMSSDLGKKLKLLKVDGGASANNLLMQFQADLLGVEIIRPRMVETTALGAAFLAGLGVGFWKDMEDLEIGWKEDRRFRPQMDKREVARHLARWQETVKKV